VSSSQTGYVEVEGGKLYYEVAGTGQPLLLIHAGVADHHMWDDQFAVFAERYRVIRYDTREFGLTTSDNVSYSDRQDIVDLLQQLGVDKTFIIGVSRGGALAIDFTLEHPELVAGLIVVAGGVSGLEGSGTEAELALFRQMEAAQAQKDYRTLIDLELQGWIDGPGQPATRVAPEMRANVRGMLTNNYARHHDEAPTARPLAPPAVHRLGEIHVPTLVIIPDLDFSETVVAMDYLAQGVAGAQKVVMHGVAHLPNMEQPAQFNQIVLDFLAGM
jgi:pimeloyl-ACP methyl ester carboxylesterase